jgi:ferredoxin-like protein FixX
MPQWFIRGLRRGVVTTRYPARPDPSSASLPTPPSFRAEELTRPVAERAAPHPIPPHNPLGRGAAPNTATVADLLIAVCPSAALRRDGDDLIFDVGACTACGACREAAPEAVTSSGEFELAAKDRGQLIKRIPLREEVAA